MTENSKRAIAGGAAVMLIGVVSLIGWMTDHAVLASAVPAISEMTFNTALSLVLIGAALLLSDKRLQNIRMGLAGLVCLLALLMLIELVLGVNLGIDNFFFDHAAAYPENPYPGRMAPATIIAFMLSSTALVLICRGCDKRVSCTLTSMLIGATGIASLYGVAMSLVFSEKPASLT